MKKLIFLFLLFTSSLVFPQDSISDVPKIVIKVPLGETIQLNAVSITFVEVLEDSRCPTDLTCIWDGRARVLVEITEKHKETYQKILLFGELLKGEIKDNVLFTADENIISGTDLYPLPTSKGDKEKAPFELLIYIEKK